MKRLLLLGAILIVARGAAAEPVRASLFGLRADYRALMQRAASNLHRPLSSAERKAIWRAHLVGAGELGRDGAAARLGNFTNAQLHRRRLALREAGTLSESEQKQLIRQGSPPRGTVQQTGRFGSDTLRFGYEVGGKEVARLVVRTSPESNRVYVQSVQVDAAFKGRGISEVLFSRLVEACGPGKLYSAEMAYDNYLAIAGHLSSRYGVALPLNGSPSPTVEGQLREALPQTPFVKAWKRLGYTDISAFRVEWSRVGGPDGPLNPAVYFTIADPRDRR